MTELATIQPQSLPSLVKRAASQLAGATTAAEVLDARLSATAAYDMAKVAGRLAKAKQAHDDVITAVYRAQADALEIEALAQRRLADEYDAAQDRGEVAGHGGARNFKIPEENLEPTLSEIGLTGKDIFEAKQVRDAEEAEPGIVRRTLDSLIEAGEEPTKAAVNRAIVNRTSFTGNNEWYTPANYVNIAFTDVDATTEIAHSFLFLEWKSGEPRDIPIGQRIYFERLTALSDHITVVVVCGDAETMATTHILTIYKGKLGKWIECDLAGLEERIAKWAKRARERAKGAA